MKHNIAKWIGIVTAAAFVFGAGFTADLSAQERGGGQGGKPGVSCPGGGDHGNRGDGRGGGNHGDRGGGRHE